MNLQEILKNNGVADDKIKKITDAMKENKIFTSNEENIDIRYGKLKEKGELELAKDGTVKGLEDKIAELKTQFPNQFESANQNQNPIDVNTLPNQFMMTIMKKLFTKNIKCLKSAHI